MPSAQGQAFPNPLSTNHIVRALYIRAQRHPWVVKNRVLTGFILRILTTENCLQLLLFTSIVLLITSKE